MCHVLDANVMEIIIELAVFIGCRKEPVIIIECGFPTLLQFKVVAQSGYLRIKDRFIVVKQGICKPNGHLLARDGDWAVGVHPIAITDMARIQIASGRP